jgi:hypothetical protein
MPKRERRGLEANRNSITPEQGELLYTTDEKTIYVGDGTTAGGTLVGPTTAKQNSSINGSAPFGGGDGPEFRCLLNACDVHEQAASGGPGFELPPLVDSTLTDKIAHFFVDKYAMADGGIVKIFMSGVGSWYTDNPILGFKITHGGTLLKPRHSGAPSSLGFALYNSSIGSGKLIRYPDNTRWTLDLELISLGVHSSAQDPLTTQGSPVNANTLVRGKIIIGDHSDQYGDTHYNPYASKRNQGRWTTGLSYSLEHTVSHHGEVYTCVAAHVAGADSDTPGEGANWIYYWRTLQIEYNINTLTLWDHDLLNEVTIEMYRTTYASKFLGGYPAWADAFNYVRGQGVTVSATHYMCIQDHLSNADQPSASDNHWHEVAGFVDNVRVDTAQAYFMGAGRPGFRSIIW